MRSLSVRPPCLSATSLVVAACSLSACSASGGEQALLPVEQEPEMSSGGAGGMSEDPGTSPPGTGNTGFGLGDDLGEEVAPAGCQQAAREFDPQIPTVFILVDRSGTMFDPIAPGSTVTAWSALRVGALEVMRELEGSVRFGFAAFAGQNLGSQMCLLELPSVAPKLGNYSDIASVYESLERPENLKETPTGLALTEVAEQLRAASEDGDKYILFVTDGEPDYCDDGNQLCPPDSVVGLLQSLASPVDAAGQPQAPIRTLMFGVTSATASIRPSVLQAFANAGAGEPVAPIVLDPNQAFDPNSLWDQCNDVQGWMADFLTTGKPQERGQTIGNYTSDLALGGSAPVYRPDPNDQAALTEQIRAALAGVKSCTFDLAEDGVQVDLTRVDLGERAKVIVNGAPVPLDTTNGWHMLSETTVQLEGDACEAWRNPTIQTSISFDFPCDIFVPR